MTLTIATANAMLNHACRGVLFVRPVAWYVQLHYDDPGPEGTASAWTAAGRQQCSSWETASYGWLRNTSSVEWTDLPDPGDNTMIGWATIWDAHSNGNCLQVCNLVRQDYKTPVVSEEDGLLIPAYYLLVQWVGS